MTAVLSLGSNVGEFLKFLPGMTAEYSASGAIDSMSIRGIGGDKTAYTTDGAPMAVAVPGGDRVFQYSATPGDLPVAGDWNGDGKTDLASPSDRTVWIFEGDGDGGFRAVMEPP